MSSAKAHNFSEELIAECTEVLKIELEKNEKISRDVLFLKLKQRGSVNLPASIALDPFKDNLGIVISEGLCKGFKGMRGRGAYIGKDPDYDPNKIEPAVEVKVIKQQPEVKISEKELQKGIEISTSLGKLEIISDDSISLGGSVYVPTYSGSGVLSSEQSVPPQPNKDKIVSGIEGTGRMVTALQIEVQANNANVLRTNVDIKIPSRNLTIEATCFNHVSRLINQVFEMSKDENGNIEIAEEKYMCKEEELDLFIRVVNNFFKSYLHYMYFPKLIWDHKK